MRQRKTVQLINDLDDKLSGKIAALMSRMSGAFNPISIPDVGAEYVNLLSDIDLQQYAARYIWTIPENTKPAQTITSWQIENMLYYCFTLCGYIRAGTLFVLPYVQQDGINIYGLPVSFKPISFNGVNTYKNPKYNGIKLLTDVAGHEVDRAENCGALLFDRMPIYSGTAGGVSRNVMINNLIRREADLLGRVKMNLQNATTKLAFYADDEQQANVLDKQLREAYGSGMPYVIILRNMATDMQADQFQSTVAVETQALFEAFQSLDAIRLMSGGMPNNGAFEKKERRITAEQIPSQNDSASLQLGLYFRKLWISQLKYIYAKTYPEVVSGLRVDINPAYSRNEEGENNDDSDDNDDERKADGQEGNGNSSGGAHAG